MSDNYTEATTKKSKKEDPLKGIQILDFPNRTLPKLIEEVLDKDIPVKLSKHGYYIGGFYGINADTENSGFVFAKDTTEAGALVFFDSKNNKHLVRSFEDLVKLHNVIWSAFYKVADIYKKPDNLWFGYMLEYGVLTIAPGSMR